MTNFGEEKLYAENRNIRGSGDVERPSALFSASLARF
jgi:hypothetical protein